MFYRIGSRMSRSMVPAFVAGSAFALVIVSHAASQTVPAPPQTTAPAAAPRTTAVPSVPYPYPYPVAPNPQGVSSPAPARAETEPVAQEVIDHLNQAAEHLAAAGRQDLARMVKRETQHAEALALLARKRSELNQLQAEIDRLAQLTQRNPTQVMLHVKVMEVSLDKLRARGVGLDDVFQDFRPVHSAGAETGRAWFHAAGEPATIATLEALRVADVLKVLAEPTLVTISGRPASFKSGGEFPILVPQREGKVAIEYREFGTRIDCVPNVLENGNIRLELRPSISEIDTTRSVQVNDMKVPGLRTRMIDTAMEVKPGQTMILVGPASRKSADEEGTALVVTAMAELGTEKR